MSNASEVARDDREEIALLAALRAGSEVAFETLVRRHGPRLLALARGLVRDESEAEDVVQESFVSAFRALESFRGEARLATWLHRITVRAALARVRARQRGAEVDIESLLPKFSRAGYFVEEPVAWGDAPGSALEREELRAAVHTGIDKLPSGYREVLMLHDIEGLDVAELAADLQLSANAVRIRLHRARQALREHLDPLLREDAS